MSIAAIGVAAGAAVISVVALTQSQPAGKPGEAVPMAHLQPAHVQVVHPEIAHLEIAHPDMVDPRDVEHAVPVLTDIPIVGRLFVDSHAAPPTGTAALPPQVAGVKINGDLKGTNFREVAELLAKEAELKLSLQMDQGFDTRAKIESIQFVEDDLATAFRRLSSAVNLTGPNRLEFRVRGDVLEVAPRDSFDRLETTLIAYDLTDAFRSQANPDGLVEIVTQFVESDGWRDNGGETARLKVVGNKMFVEAPPRYHERVAWILSQFSGSSKGAAPRAANRPATLNKTVVGQSPAGGMFGHTTGSAGHAGSPFGSQAANAAGMPGVGTAPAPATGAAVRAPVALPSPAPTADPAIPGTGAMSAPAGSGAPGMPSENKP